jgi:integrase
MKLALTDIGIRNAAAPAGGQLDLWDTSFKGGRFGVRVSRGGSKTFMLKYRDRRVTLGRFPVLSLADARGEARRIIAEFTLGKLRPNAISYEDATNLFLEEKRKTRRARTADHYEWLLGLFNFKGNLSTITHNDIERVVAKVKSPSTKNHAAVALKVFFTWAHKKRLVSDNPTFGLSTQKSPPRARVLTDDELRRVWTATDKIGGHFGTIVKLLVLSGQRRGEIAALQSSWINEKEKTITIPAGVTKNGREHTFPIEPCTSSVLPSFDLTSTTHPIFLFPARTPTDTPFNGWSKSKAALDKISGVRDWTLHDLRRTFATRLAEMGIAPITFLAA